MKMDPLNSKHHQHFHLSHSAMTTRNEQTSSTTLPRTTTVFPTVTPNTLTLTTMEPSIIITKQHSQSKNGQSPSASLRTQPIARKTIKSSPAAATNSTLRSHKTDAPMLNYIFDSHLATNKHHHHDR